MDLIFAEATPPGRGGVSIIRLSGSGSRRTIERLVGELPTPRHCYFRQVREDGEVLDSAVAIWFEEGQSFTGEESAELHLHGAPVVVKRACLVLGKLGARLAEPGEFTRRAFVSGRLDLAEVEGLADLLEAETEAQRQLAVRAMNGELQGKVTVWRDQLIRAGALVEVSVDFADEDVPDEVPLEVLHILDDLRGQLQVEIDGYPAAERVRKGFEVALIGPVNAGKSSLINRISKRDVVLVSNIAGTTRDIIEVRLDLNGLAVTLLDTAGIRLTDDEIEAMGVNRAKQRAMAADLRVHLSEAAVIDRELWREGDISVRSKSDLAGGDDHSLRVSSFTGEGVESLLAEIFDRLSDRVSGASVISNERQVQSLRLAVEVLNVEPHTPVELISESIRQAASALDRMLGKIGSEEYLDVIFSSFCIGK